MSWEPTDEWPDGRAGGVFRGAAEVVLAQRTGVRFRERLRLWWESTPDHPFAAIARRAALTPNWLYTEGRDGVRRRVRTDRLIGSRREAGRVIYAVAEGDDLVLPDRRGDAFERHLDERLGVQPEAWRSPRRFLPVLIFTAIGCAMATAAVVHYFDGAIRRIREGLVTSESALGLYAGAGGLLLLLLFILFFPQWYVIDTLGITSRRGLFGFMRSTVPAERVERVDVERRVTKSAKNGTHVQFRVDVRLRDPRAQRTIHAGKFVRPFADAEERNSAAAIAHRVARIFDAELVDRT